MHIKTLLTNLGVAISCGDSVSQPLSSQVADQANPRRSYVYAHCDSAGKIFYVGKGVDRRAWSTDRDSLWHRYVTEHLQGNYSVQILQDDLTDEDAERLEAAWIAQCDANALINWQNASRRVDYAALDRHSTLQNANRAAIDSARAMEKTDPEAAIAAFVACIEAADKYAFQKPMEPGLVGKLMEEEGAYYVHGETLIALDRLSLLLIRMGRVDEAQQRTAAYFAKFPRHLDCAPSAPIMKRIQKAIARRSKV